MKNAFLYLITFVSLNVLATSPVRSEVVGQAQESSISSEDDRMPLARQLVALILPNVGQDAMEGLKMGVLSHLDTVDDPAMRTKLEADIEASMVVAAPIMGRHMAAMTEAYAQAYAGQYDGEELRQIIAFAGTPAGKHFLTQNIPLDTDPGVLAEQDKLMADVVPVFVNVSRSLCQYQAGQHAARGERDAKCSIA
jgi:hypothetical protein